MYKRVFATGEADMNMYLSASASYMNIGHLEKEIKRLELLGASSFHVDIMDGRFVSNFAMSLNDMKCIAKYATKPIEAHLMLEHPCTHIDIFLKELRKGDTVYIHPEAEYHPSTTLQKIIDAGMVPGIAINPGTSVETIVEMLNIVKKVLVMSVNPGEDEKLYRDSVQKKISKLISLKEETGIEIYLDGAVTSEKINDLSPKGVDGFVIEDFDIIRNENRAVTMKLFEEPITTTKKKVLVG